MKKSWSELTEAEINKNKKAPVKNACTFPETEERPQPVPDIANIS